MGDRDLLEAEPNITVIGEPGTAASALARIPALRQDVAVLDVRFRTALASAYERRGPGAISLNAGPNSRDRPTTS